MKKEALIIISLLVLQLFLISVYAIGEQKKGFIESNEGFEKSPSEVISSQISTALQQRSTLDFSQPLFKSNPDLVRRVLLEEYNVDLNVNTLDGVKISSGKLTLPGGSSFNLETGKMISLNAAGASISSFSDGSMVVVNAIGVDYDGTNLRVERGEKVKYGTTESNNVRNFVGEQSTVSSISKIAARFINKDAL